jgi:hypothetical protein
MPRYESFDFYFDDEQGCTHYANISIDLDEFEHLDSTDGPYEIWKAIESEIDDAVSESYNNDAPTINGDDDVPDLIEEIRSRLEEEEIGPYKEDEEEEGAPSSAPPPRRAAPAPARQMTQAEKEAQRKAEERQRERDFFFGKKPRRGGMGGLMGLSSWQPRRRR